MLEVWKYLLYISLLYLFGYFHQARDMEGAEVEAGVVAEVIVVDEAGWVVGEEGVAESSIGKKSLLSEVKSIAW